MSTTRINFNQIKGAATNVFDYMTAAQITSIQAMDFNATTQAGVTAALNLAFATNWSVYVPAGGYVLTSSLMFPLLSQYVGQHIIWDSVTLKASGVVTNFTQIYSNPASVLTATGLYTMVDPLFARSSTWDGNLTIDGSSIANIVGFGTSLSGNALVNPNIGIAQGPYDSNFNLKLTAQNCTWGIYAQTSAGQGTFTGMRFAYLAGSGTTGFMFLGVGNDDIEVDTMRSQGVVELANTGLNVKNWYCAGGAPATGTYIGLSQGSNCRVIIDHGFWEKDFQYGVILAGATASLEIRDLIANCTLTDAVNNAVVFVNATNCMVDITMRSPSAITPAVICRVEPASATERFRVCCPWPLDPSGTTLPIAFTLTGATTANNVLIADMTDGIWYGTYASGALLYRKFSERAGYITLFDQSSASFGDLLVSALGNKVVVNLGSYNLDDVVGNYIVLNSTNTASTVYLIAGTRVGRKITLVSGNTLNNITVSGAVGVGRLANPGTPYALLPSQANSITFIFTGTNWLEESRIAY